MAAKKKSRKQNQVVHSCVEMPLPPEKIGAGLISAQRERPDNILAPGMAANFGVTANQINAPAMAVVTKKLWKPGRTIRVRFMGSVSARVKEAIATFAQQWQDYADIFFQFGNDSRAEIRVTAHIGLGSWSYLGTDALTIPKNRATMNFGWFTNDTPEAEFSRTTLHEFGHALGCIHEHSNPKSQIPWDKPKVYDYYKRTQNWSKQQVDDQVFAKYAVDQVNSSEYDPKSIMHYPVPEEHTVGPFSVGLNTKLSDRDKSFIGEQY